MNKNYRIHTEILNDSALHVNMRQNFDFMEVLSITLSQKEAYKLHSSNYGVIVGRVLANDAFGIPNAKVSVFIEKEDNEINELENIYPFTDVTGKDSSGRRYNLLPDYSDDECYRVVGTFPNKRLLLDNNIYIEVYDKYWKYSTVTNNAGDYMIFGVPTGSHQIHVDIDMSDIGVLSQKPRDYMYKGYTETLFDTSTQFKSSTNLDDLTQIFSQNKSVYVYPFWGDAENGIAAITRADIQVNYKFEPTCVFMGSIVSDNGENCINHNCSSKKMSGFNRQLVAGEGTIEMIRKTQDGLVEEFPIQGNMLIDSDGVWCYQIPMNLDYVGTDEYGNIVPTDNPTRGIPTRTQVRFRISKTETGDEGFSRHTAKYLVPMNPVLDETKEIPTTEETSGEEMERMYAFGSNTPQSCFRDLYWNNVYSVKNFIPKTQVARRAYSPYYNGLKACNTVNNQNPIPFNKLMVNVPFSYMFICLVFTIVITIISFINGLINILNGVFRLINNLADLPLLGGYPFSFLHVDYIGCIPMQAGTEEDNTVYYPGCNDTGMRYADCPEGMDSCKRSNKKQNLMDVIQQTLSQEYDVVRLDLYQDWLNGCLYMPLWFWKKTKKHKFLFITLKHAKNKFCDSDKTYSRLKTRHTCSIKYNNNSLGVEREDMDPDHNKWHKVKEKGIWFKNGLIKGVMNNAGLTAYYYAGFQPSSNDKNKISDIKKRTAQFEIVRLFATDIILLGNLNESNIYGIPQLFNRLPSSTSNIPPIASIQETNENETKVEKREHNENLDDLSLANDDGELITVTGMDWGHSGQDDTPMYKKGLFFDLACLYANVKSKACVNVERLSELGISLDLLHKVSYARGNDLVEGVVDSDGFINKFEIDDNESRSMFATMNHVGFVPQDYQDEHNMYETQVMDENTGYFVPKFKYIYPVDFDGRMNPIMSEYENNFAQPLYDNTDESYLTFRLGAEKDSKHGRKRHFYYTPQKNQGKYEMPLYNNSFYFYFGINRGNTAIEKFTKKFISPCSTEIKKPFSMVIRTQGKVECPCIYSIDSYKNPFIKVTMDDIQVPYSYVLRNGKNNIVSSGANMTESELLLNDTNVVDGILNQAYTLTVKDANEKTLSERITVETQPIGVTVETERLGTKFYDIESTRVDHICTYKTMFYGKIRLKGFYVDGYDFYITNAVPICYDEQTNSYVVKITGENDVDINGTKLFNGCAVEAIVRLSSVENKSSSISDDGTTSTNNGIKNCLCDKNNPIAINQGSSANISIETAYSSSPCWFGKTDETSGEIPGIIYPEFYLYQPGTYAVTIIQYCMNEMLTANTTSELVSVQNGQNFNAYLNRMPVRFMIGTENDSVEAEVAENSNFYKKNVVEDEVGAGLNGWYGVHQEDTYKFVPTTTRYRKIWSDYVTIGSKITSPEARKKILKFKFDSMFSLSEGVYVTTASSVKFLYYAEGGYGFPLNRTVAPEYDTSDLFDKNEKYELTEDMGVYGTEIFPNIVGKNYSGCTGESNTRGPIFNKFFKNGGSKQGNYFAIFSNNGGYINNKTIDPSIPVIKQPNYTAISPINSGTKEIGKKITLSSINRFKKAYTKVGDTMPYLRALFIDRRLDYDLVILSPSTGQNIRLYDLVNGDESKKELIWKGSRISGTTYGGIEMSYDEKDDYNILSADISEDGTVATPNNNLEYSYNYSGLENDDAKTVFNLNPATKRRLYEAMLNGYDIREMFWSTNRAPEIWQMISNQVITSGEVYYYKYPYTNNTLYNGDFYRTNDSSYIKRCYPTRRYIDVGNIPSVGGETNLILTSCKYNVKATMEPGSNELKMRTMNGESVEYDFNFENNITMVSSNSDNETFGNIVYSINGTSGGYYKLSAGTANVIFKIEPYSCDGFDVYTKAPLIIKVLPYTSGVDGITYYKTTTKGSSAEYVANKTLEEALDTVAEWRFRHVGKRKIIIGTSSLYYETDTITEENISYDDGFKLRNGKEVPGEFLKNKHTNEFIRSDANEFNNIVFNKVLRLNDVSVFTIVLEREYLSYMQDNLFKHIKTVEMTSLFDARHLLMKVDADNTYVKVNDVQYAPQPPQPEPDEDEEEGGGGGNDEPVTDETKTPSQTISFEFKFNFSGSPNDSQCEAFADAETMAYSFIFKDRHGETYKLFPSYVNLNEETGIMNMTVKWSSNMGILADKKWSIDNGDGTWTSHTKMLIMGKTKENFVYRLGGDNWLSVKFSGFVGGVTYDQDTKETNMEEGVEYKTNISLK